MAREIGSLNVVVGLDATGFQNGIGKLNTEMKKVQSEFKLASTELGKHGKELDGLKLKSDSLTKQTELQRQKVNALKEAHEKSVETKGKDAKATQELEIKLNQAQSKLNSMEQSLSSLNKEIELQSNGFYKLSQALEPVGQKMQDIGKKMESVGTDLTKKITLPLVAIGTAAGKTAIDFESAFAGVKKTVDATDNELNKLETGIRNMSKEIPASASAIAEVTEAAGQLGIETDNILGFTRVMIDLGEATNLSSDEAATSLARLANITGMSQTDFDRLGSTIVALGNNLATTESEIVAMGLRLAGAGSQIGMTEAQIMSFAGALSSVGIEAEAGGSAFSKVMVDMQLAVETGSDRLNDFANVAGMSAEEFKKAFQEDAGSAIISFIKGLGNAEEQGKSAIAVLDDMGITEVRVRDALLRASGASDVFTSSLEIGTRAWEGNTALTKEAEQRYQTTASQIEIAKNHLKDVGITIGEIVVPHLVSLSEKVKEVSEWFANLSPATQETIVKIGLVAAAIGPLLVIGGKLIAGIGTAITAVSTISGAIAVVTTGATAATPAIGALATVFTVLTGPVGLAVAAIAAVTVAGVALYKHLNQESIPEIQLFGDEVSESTKKAVGGFLELNDQATIALNQLSWSGQEVTKEMADKITGNFKQMAADIQAGLDSHHEESLGKIQGFVNNSTSLSKEEQDQILNNMNEGYESRKQKVSDGEARIKEILETASKEKRGITKAEQEEINAIQQEMVETGIRVLSENEVEAKSIMERMKAQAGEITAKQAAEVVKNSIEQKDKTVKAANDQYDEVVKEIIRQRDEAGTITKDQADKLIKEAKRQRDDTVKNAEEMHTNVVKEAKAQAEEHVNQVDWETGEIKTKWQAMKTDIAEKAKQIKEDVKNKWEEIKKDSSEKWENIKTDTANKWNDMKTDTISKAQEIKTNVATKWSEIKTDTAQKWSDIKTDVSEKASDIKKKIIDSITDSESEWGRKAASMLTTTRDKFSSMASKVSEAFSTVVSSIKSGIDKLLEWNRQKVEDKKATFTTVFREIKEKVTSTVSNVFGGGSKNYSGTSFFQGGLTMVGELGPELVELPRGSKIYNDNVTKKMLSGDKGITQHIVINSPKHLSPYETARKIKNASKELAMEW